MNIPKKLGQLDYDRYPNDRDHICINRDKINELIDYLQDKEEASKGEGKRVVMCNECMPPKPMNDHKYLKGVIIHERTDCPPDTLYMVNENLFDKPTPPQQEESKGEHPFQHNFEPDKSGNCWCNIPKESDYHTHPESKGEDKPKMMTIKEFNNESKEFQDSHCFIRETIYADVKCPVYKTKDCPKCNPPEHEEDFDRLAQGPRNHVIDDVRFSGLFEYVKDYIRDNFVSKEKFQAKLDIAEERGYWEGRLETELKKPISKKRASQINENRLFAENVKSGGMKEVTDEYVSKEKIKEVANLCGYVQHGKFIDKEDLLNSLGLGD